MSNEAIDKILQALDAPPPQYPRAELDEAVSLRNEITPHLLRMLEQMTTSPDLYTGVGLKHFYVVALLAHFQEAKAHLPIIRAFSLDEDKLDGLWGDVVTETLPTLLLKTCGGDLDAIKKLALDETVYLYARWAAMNALTLAVVHGIAVREEMIEFCTAILQRHDQGRKDCGFNAQVAEALTDLWPGDEVLPIIKAAWDSGMIDPNIIDWDDIEEAAETPKEAWLKQERERDMTRLPETIHDYFNDWPCFHPEERPTPVRVPNSSKPEKSRKKAKKKMAAKSKKRNKGR